MLSTPTKQREAEKTKLEEFGYKYCPICGKPSPQIQRESWEEKFDDEFAVQKNPWGDDFTWADNADAKATKIKKFISQTLSDQRKELMKKIQGLCLDEFNNFTSPDAERIYDDIYSLQEKENQ